MGARAGTRKTKSGSLLPNEAEVAAAQEHWNSYCQSLQDDKNCPVPVGTVRPRFDLLDGDQDIGMDEFRHVPADQLWANLGLPGATRFPFSEPGDATKPGAAPKWHQIAGVHAILNGAFTSDLKQSARPTLLCDDVGLGKTLQIIGAISMIAHMREQQEQRPDKSLLLPPFAVSKSAAGLCL
jgi:SNF2 family DNA or RNA helicase